MRTTIMKRALIALAGALIAAIALADIRGTWTIEHPSRAGEGTVQLNLSRDHNHFGSTFPTASFTNLSLADGASQFELRAEAGTIRFDGTFRDGDGAGHFTFLPNAKFADTLRSMNVREIGDVDDEKLLQLAMHGVSTDFIRSMRAEGYDVTLDKYVAMRIFRVTPQLIQELRTLGFDKLSYDNLIASRVHRVTPDYIRSMRAAGYTLSMNDLLASRIHRVDPDFAKQMRDLGYPNLKFDDMIAFRIHGVTPEFISTLKTLGYQNVDGNDLVAMRIHGVTPDFIKELAELGYRNISIDNLVTMRIHGVTPKYIRELKDAGYEKVPVEKLVSMRIHGVDAAFIGKLK
jgi:hypothetical protein